MTKIAEYLKLVIFLGGMLVGIQVPGFVDQYGHNLTARIEESKKGLSEFQDDADRYFGGDLERLIAYYAGNSDPVFASGGQSIGALVSRNQQLTQALSSYKSAWYSPYTHVLFNPVEEIRQNVWKHYDYSVVLNGHAILFGLVAGLASAALLELLLLLPFAILRALFGSSRNEILTR